MANLHPGQFQPFMSTFATPRIHNGSDVSFRKDYERPDSPFTSPMSAAMAMRPNVATGNTFIDHNALMRPRGLTGDIHPTTFD